MITVDIYERTRIIANSLRSITSNNVDKEITGVMQDRYRTSIARYVGEDNAESARIFRLADTGDKLYILAVVDDISRISECTNNYINCIMASSGALRQYRDTAIYIADKIIYDNVYNVYKFIENIYGYFGDINDLISIAFCVLTEFVNLYTDEDLDRISKDITKKMILCGGEEDTINNHYLAIRYALEDMLNSYTIYGFIPDIYSIALSLKDGCKRAGDNTWMDPNRRIIWRKERNDNRLKRIENMVKSENTKQETE